MAAMINCMDNNDHIQDLFECIYKICLQEQEQIQAPQLFGGKSNLHMSQALVSPEGTPASLPNMNVVFENGTNYRGM